MAPITAVVLGAGARGQIYGEYALEHPDEIRIVAIAEPDAKRRAMMAAQHDLPPEMCFHTWEELLAQPQLADAAINTTMDRLHTASTLAALGAGYQMLLEKPMSPILEENVRLVRAAEAQGRLLMICHVLRYTSFFQTVREIVQSGRLGEIISVDHCEALSYWHMAHSYVRGNWRSLAAAGPMILTKCCHDFDILLWILQRPVLRLNSFGSLRHFRPENAPLGATQRCTDGCPAAPDCKYDAVRFYGRDGDAWPLPDVAPEPVAAARLAALREGPYGRCVYHCDNDVVDHQTVNMELEGGLTVTLTMNGQGHEPYRSMRYDGTRATLYARFAEAGHSITVHDHLSSRTEHVPVQDRYSGGRHGGGDFGLVRSFVRALRGQPDETLTTARESLESHLLAFAAEQARVQHSVIEMAGFRAKAEAAAGT